MKAPSELPYPLALLRIVLPVVIVVSPELYDATPIARSPEHLMYVPEGLGVDCFLRQSRAWRRDVDQVR